MINMITLMHAHMPSSLLRIQIFKLPKLCKSLNISSQQKATTRRIFNFASHGTRKVSLKLKEIFCLPELFKLKTICSWPAHWKSPLNRLFDNSIGTETCVESFRTLARLQRRVYRSRNWTAAGISHCNRYMEGLRLDGAPLLCFFVY